MEIKDIEMAKLAVELEAQLGIDIVKEPAKLWDAEIYPSYCHAKGYKVGDEAIVTRENGCVNLYPLKYLKQIIDFMDSQGCSVAAITMHKDKVYPVQLIPFSYDLSEFAPEKPKYSLVLSPRVIDDDVCLKDEIKWKTPKNKKGDGNGGD